MGLFGSKQTIGYQYFLGIEFVLGLPMDSIFQIWYGEKCAWPTADDPSTMASPGLTSGIIDAAKLFGGKDAEGGISGNFDIQYGAGNQAKNAYLVEQLGEDISAHRFLTSVIFNQVYLGTSKYIKPISFLGSRVLTLTNRNPQWYLSKADVNGQLNAVHILHEYLTSTEWGLGENSSNLDAMSWEYAADQCYDEGIGLSIELDRSSPIEEFCDTILEIIDGAWYEDDETGKWIIKLAREDYNPDNLDEYDEDDILSITDFNRPGWGDIPGYHYVKWWDLENHKERVAFDYDPSIIARQSGIPITQTYDLQSITDGEVANMLAARRQKQSSALLAKMTLHCKRSMSSIRPNDVFKISFPRRRIESMIVRTLEVDLGTLENPEVKIQVTEDVFGTAYNVIAANIDTSWTDPASDAEDVSTQQILVAPFWTLSTVVYGQSGAEALSSDIDLIIPLAVKPTSDHTHFDLLVRNAAGLDFLSQGYSDFCPSSLLAEAMLRIGTSQVASLSETEDLDIVEENHYCLIGNEILAITAIDIVTGEVTLERGVLDTIPESHSIGDRVWFCDGQPLIVDTQFASGATPAVKYLTETPIDTLEEGDATTYVSAALDQRQARPYPPGYLRVNSVALKEDMGIPILSELTVAWVHRDRTHATQNIQFVPQNSTTSYGPESSVTYTLTIYDPSDSQLRQETGLTGVSYTYDAADERSDGGLGGGDPLHDRLRFELKAVRGGLDSFQEYDIIVRRSFQGHISATSSVSASLSFGS